MNYLVQRGKVRGQVINVPEGFPELLSDVTREVLRCQPTTECLCQFVIDYLHSVIVTREKAKVAKGIIDRALRQVDEIISDLCICDITKEKASEMALAMEQCFKRFLEQYRCERRKEKEVVKFGEIDMLDELINRCKFSEDELKITRPMIEEAYNRFVDAYMRAAEGTEGTEALYLYFKEREQKRIEQDMFAQAATKIQANFRGFLVRRELFIDHKQPVPPEVEDYEKESPEQKFYRHIEENAADLGGGETEGVEKESFKEICSPKSMRSEEAGVAAEGLPKEPSAYSAPHDLPAEFEESSHQKLEGEHEAPGELEEVDAAPIEEPAVQPTAEEPEEPEAEVKVEMEVAPEPEPEPEAIAEEPAAEPVPEPAEEANAEPTEAPAEPDTEAAPETQPEEQPAAE